MGNPRDTGNAGSQSFKTNLELLNEIDDMLENSSEDALDLDALRANLKILQERAPVEPAHTRQESWDALMSGLETEASDGAKAAKPSRSSRGLKLLRFLEIAAAIVLIVSITASAFGFNPFQPLLRAVSDIVQSINSPGGILELPETRDAEYHSLREALDVNGAADAQCLTWIPKDFSFFRAAVQKSDAVTKYIGYYTSEERDLLVNITEFDSEDFTTALERNAETEPETIIIGGREYQRTNNVDITTIWWNDGRYDYELHGKFTEKEMEAMIKSFR